MATIVETPSGKWKAVIRKHGWPTATKAFRIKRDAIDWARRAEDEMVQGVHIDRAQSARLTFDKALSRLYETIPGVARRVPRALAVSSPSTPWSA